MFDYWVGMTWPRNATVLGRFLLTRRCALPWFQAQRSGWHRDLCRISVQDVKYNLRGMRVWETYKKALDSRKFLEIKIIISLMSRHFFLILFIHSFQPIESWLVVGNIFYFPIQLGMSSTQLTHIFQRGSSTNSQKAADCRHPGASFATEARTLLVLLNTFSLVLLTAQKLAAVGQPEERGCVVGRVMIPKSP